MEKYDVTIIGSGPGGYVSAIRCAQLGLKVARDTVQSREAVILELPLLIAILNSKDEVKSYESLSFKMAFPEKKEVIYPVINTKVEIPKYGRVVISLVSEIIKP